MSAMSIGYYKAKYGLKTYITKSRSGHYTVTIKHDGWAVATAKKIGHLAAARQIASTLELEVGARLAANEPRMVNVQVIVE